MEYRFEQTFVRFVEKIHKIHTAETEASKKIDVIPRETDKDPNQIMYDQVWKKIGKAAQNREKQEWAKEKPKLVNARKLKNTLLIQMTENTKKLSKTQEEYWKDQWHLATPKGGEATAWYHESDAKQWQWKKGQNNVWL